MAITVRDIAKQAGVSPATVSLVINNKKGVGEATRLRVQAVLDHMQYKPVALRNKQRFRIAVVKYRAHGMAVEENQGFIASIIDQIEQECARKGFRVSVSTCDARQVAQCVSDINRDPPDGLILIGTELSRLDSKLLDGLHVPVVVLDNSMRFEKRDSVVMDNTQIMRLAVRHLYEKGHRHIGYLRSNKAIDNLDERYEGYLDAMAELGLSVPDTTLLATTLNGAYRDMRQLIAQGLYTPQGAAVADNDSIAIGAAKAIQEAGYVIPDNLSLIGVDDIPYSAVMAPALSTVRISRSAMGLLAVKMLTERVDHPDWPPMTWQVAGILIERDSVRAVDAPKEA